MNKKQSIALFSVFVAFLTLSTYHFISIGYDAVGDVLQAQTAQLSPTLFPSPIITENLLSQPVRVHVTRVIDGDTLVVIDENNKEFTVRLIGIDTPETKKPGTPIECFGLQATEYLSILVEDKDVYIVSDSSQAEVDRYNRLLRYIFANDNQLINEQMILQGYAFEYTYDKPYVYQDLFKEAQLSAQTNTRGLWNPEVCFY